jgi:hypothetical protein
MDGYEKLRKEIEFLENIVSLNEKRIARLDMLIANAQTLDMKKTLMAEHDAAISEWYVNYERLLMLRSIIE